MATFAKIKENYSGCFLGLLLAALVIFLINPTYADCINMIRALPQLTTCIFGFLLTLLGIILQSNGPVITKMKDSTVIYGRFISFNKRIVILSFGVTILALVMGYFNYDWLKTLLMNWHSILPTFVRKFFIFVLTCSSTCLVVDLMVFVKLFYMLIKESNDIPRR